MTPNHLVALQESFDRASQTVGVSVGDPFSKACVQDIYLRVGRRLFRPNEVEFSGRIEFKTGTTEGTHRFSSDSFEGLLATLSSLLKGLPE